MKIGNKDYETECNAFTMISYKKIFGRGIVQDVNILNVLAQKQVEIIKELAEKIPDLEENELLVQVANKLLTTDIADEYIEVLTKVAWILIYTADNKIKKYEDWLKEIPVINLSDKWVAEVTEIAVNNFR